MKHGGCLLVCVLLAACNPHPAPSPLNLSSWMLPPVGPVQPAPRSVHLGYDGALYVLDTYGRVLVLEPKTGATRALWNMPAFDVGRPEGICLLRDGRIAVADTHYSRVVLFHADGSLAATFGSHGTGPGQFIYPVAIDEDPKGNLYVAEYGSNDRIQVFASDFSFLRAFGRFGEGVADLQRPAGIQWFDHKVYVADALNHRVQVYAETGEHLGQLPADGGEGPYLPYDLAVTPEGDVYVVEYGGGVVSRFSPDGPRTVLFPGALTLLTPWSMDVRDKVLVLADTGQRRIVYLETAP